jgi:hypothetical protein
MSLIFPLALQVVGAPCRLLLLRNPPRTIFGCCTSCRLRMLLVVRGRRLYPCGRVVVALPSRWSQSCSCFHFPHLELLTASPPIVSQPGFGGSCAELDLEAFAKAFLAPVSVDNGCGPLCSSPR